MKENSDNVDMDVDDDDDDNNISENFLVKRIKTFSFEDYIWIKKKILKINLSGSTKIDFFLIKNIIEFMNIFLFIFLERR